MLYRKIETAIYKHFMSKSDKILMLTGARQTGKSFIINYIASKIFRNVVEINLIEDYDGNRLFESVSSLEEFHLRLSSIAGDRLGTKEETLVFLDEIQQYPQLLTLLKFLRQEGRYTYAVSGSLLGLTLKHTTSIPVGSLALMHMYPLDFEEFLIANNVNKEAIERIRLYFDERKSLDEAMHNHIMSLFKRYLLIGGMPQAVQDFVNSRNLVTVRAIQSDIHRLYKADASKYDMEHRLHIERIYEMIPSAMESHKKRVIYREIENKPKGRHSDYVEEFDFLSASGVALEVKAISNPSFPLLESGVKNLLKLYLNDVGILTGILYHNNIKPVLDSECSVNLGSVYETVVAMELASHGNKLFYYDNKKNGEVDFLIDDYYNLSAMAIEVKSGKDYTVHSALSKLLENKDYRIKEGFVFSNSREVRQKGNISYLPIYYVMFLDEKGCRETEIIL
ncbi:MAG: AAA family ATPase [Muribaculaceae bacterium]|nr:AAA family ATPase [Muribaculaceae bacterium]